MADSAHTPPNRRDPARPQPDAKARQAGRKSAGIDQTVAAPIVPAIIENDPDSLLDARQIHDRIVVRIPQWGPNPTNYDETLWFQWARPDTPDTEYELGKVTVQPGTVFPLDVYIDPDDYLQGSLVLTYTVENYDINLLFSEPTPITVDSIPPYGDLSPESPLPPDYTGGKDGVITDEFLNANDGKAVFTIPKNYTDHAPEDTVYFYWLKNVPEDVDNLPPPTIAPFPFSQTDKVELEKTHLEAVGDGICAAVYVIEDKAHNLSRISWWEVATVALGPLPSNLLAPTVPQADDADGVVNRKDGYEGVQVRIPAFDGWKNGDMIHARWGNASLPVYPIGPAPDFPLDIPVPWQAITENYDYQHEDATQQVTVGYQVTRGNLPFPDNPLTAQVNVDLRVVGPDKEDPNPINDTLPVIMVKGASEIDNQLPPADTGQDATASFLLFEGAKENDEIWLYWGGLLNPTIYYVGAQDVPGTTVVSITVPWNLIEEANNSLQMPVYYRITDASQVNYQQSPTTPVRVEAVVVDLPPPEFPDIYVAESGRRILNCTSIWDKQTNPGFRVHIPPSRHIKVGMEITFDWVVTEQPDGTGAIAGTELTDKIIVTPDHLVSGIPWYIAPYAEKILPAWSETAGKRGYTRLKYSTFIGEIPAETDYVSEDIGLTSGTGSCPLE